MAWKDIEPGDKTLHLAQFIRGNTSDGKDLTRWLVEICKDKKTKVGDRIRAIELLFNRGWGKPKEELTITIDVQSLQEFSIEELRGMLDVVEVEVKELPPADRKLLPERMASESVKVGSKPDELSEGNRDSTSSTVDAEFVEISPKMAELTGETQEC